MLELTTRFRGITTGAGSRHRTQSGREAVGAALAHLRYIARPGAAIEVAASGCALNSHDPGEINRHALHQAMRARLERRAGSGGKVGRRVAEKLIVSLPTGWDQAARVAAIQRVVEHLAPTGSEAMAVAYSHGDKPGNPHFHILAVDGLESAEAAIARRPDALRVRRRDVIRLGDRGRPKALRREIAGIINAVAAERGLGGVEWRSFKDRGILRSPGKHEGAEKRARLLRQAPKSARPIRRSGRVSMAAKTQTSRRAMQLVRDLFDVVDERESR